MMRIKHLIFMGVLVMVVGQSSAMTVSFIQASGNGDTLTYKVLPSKWTLPVTLSFLVGDAALSDDRLAVMPHLQIGVERQLGSKYRIGLQAGVSWYDSGLRPLRFGVEATRIFPVKGVGNIFVSAAGGTQISYAVFGWGGTEWKRLVGEKLRPFGQIKSGLEFGLPRMQLRIGAGYQIQHIYQRSEPQPWSGFERQFILRNMTVDLTASFRLGKVFRVD